VRVLAGTEPAPEAPRSVPIGSADVGWTERWPSTPVPRRLPKLTRRTPAADQLALFDC
jgi:hypothetical protein